MWLTKAHTSQEAPASTSGSSSPCTIKNKLVATATEIMLKFLYNEKDINKINKKIRRNRMKKLLVGLLLVSSLLSFGAQKVPYEKLSFANGYIYYNDEEYTGEFERKDAKTGTINMVASVKNGKLHGMTYSYDESGRLIEEITYKNGLREGSSKTYYKSGVVSAKLTYKNDKYEGVQKYYYENGKLQAEIPTREGIVDGVTKLYDKNGKFEREAFFMTGKKL